MLTTITTTAQGIDQLAEEFAGILSGDRDGLNAGEMEAARKAIGKAVDLVLSLAEQHGLSMHDLHDAHDLGTAGRLLTDSLARV